MLYFLQLSWCNRGIAALLNAQTGGRSIYQMEIEIPTELAKLLEGDTKLHGAAILSLAEFKPWLDHSGTPFFPEYTDHGFKHVSDTLATASAIICDAAWPHVTAADVGTLVLSVLLHDCPLHLSEDGFVSLVRSGTDRTPPEGFGDAPWPSLWLDFLGEASRFDARKLNALFGDTEPTHNPGLDPKTWTMRDRLLMGEFLRRHHARLAHEVALWGVPGPTDKPLRLREAPGDIADIAGLIARSHGQPIRACLPYLGQYDLRQYKGVHAVFLMAVIRVADYLQVQSDRAPEQVLRIRQLRSPVSQGEWKAHEAIRDIRNTHDDPEAIFIDAAPTEVKTYLKVKRLLAAIQGELDGSWAALGEVYGRLPGLNQLGLRIRRVRSNLDDEVAFARSVPYVPAAAAFEAAGADLLGLLIKPLYGEHPEIAIRELVQNGIDACRELRDYLEQQPRRSAPDLPSQEGDVVVRLEEGEEEGTGWLEVADRGIGMTADVVRNYFLRAGASFRRSDAWRRMHEGGASKSRVMRSGRFGIGALASFLLGDGIEVSTRHVDVPRDEGIAFNAGIDSSEIELLRCRRLVGTTVRIRISESRAWDALKGRHHYWDAGKSREVDVWDWYCLSDPSVVRIQQRKGRRKLLQQHFSLPLADSTLPQTWHKITHADYSEIQWTYQAAPRLTCNGISVIEPHERHELNQAVEQLWGNDYFDLRCPNISVFDPDGHLPLLLRRTGLATERYPFHEDLLRDVVKDLLAFVLVNAPENSILEPSSRASYSRWYEGLFVHSRQWLPFLSLTHGSSLAEDWPLIAVHSRRVLLLPSVAEDLSALQGANLPEVIIPFAAEQGTLAQRAWFRFVFGQASEHEFDYGLRRHKFGPALRLNPHGSRMLILQRTYLEFRRPAKISMDYWRDIREEASRNGWVLLASGKCDGLSVDFAKLMESAGAELEGLTEWYVSPEEAEKPESSPIARGWEEILGSPVIPFDWHERRRKFHAAFDMLKEYIDKHERRKEKASNGENQASTH